MPNDKNFVPRLDGTGSLGRSDKKWNEIHAKDYYGNGSNLTGITGAQGNDGADGDSAYDIWIAAGNTGTEQDFLDSLVGATGAQGPSGSVSGSVDMGGTMTAHIIPSANALYDLGNAEYKIRHLFLSDNSLWVGDEHKISIVDGSMKFKKRNGVPLMLENAMANAHGSVFLSIDNFVAQGILTLDGRNSITVGNLRLDEVYLIADQLVVPHEDLFREQDMDNDFNDDVVELSTAGAGMLPDLATAKLGTMIYDTNEHNVKVVASDDGGVTKIWKTLSFV